MLNLIYLIGGLVIILISAVWLVDGASSLAKRAGVPDLVIGLTIVAFGTSAPEFSVNIFSAVKGSGGIALGNILGSNICNILLILGVSSVIQPLGISLNTKWREIPLSLLAAVVLFIMLNDSLFNGPGTINSITRSDGLLLLCFLLIFLAYTFVMALRGGVDFVADVKLMPMWKSLLFVAAGFAGLFAGGKFLVDGAVNIARIIGLSEKVIGITIVAVGTSLPELATSAVAACKHKADIAVGNVIGSNILNIFFILGATSLIRPLAPDQPVNVDIFMAIFASFMLFIVTITFRQRTIDRIEGAGFIAMYIGYITYLLV